MAAAAVHPAPQRGPVLGPQTAAALQLLKDEAQELLDAGPRQPPAAAAAAARAASPAPAARSSPAPPLSPLGAAPAAGSCSPPSLPAASSPPALSPLSVDGVNPLLSPRLGRKLACGGAALASACAALSSHSSSPRSAAAPRDAEVSGDGGVGSRLADGLEAGSHAVEDTRTDVLQDRMRRRTRHRDDYPTEKDWCPGILEWIVSFPDAFDRAFTPEQRMELGRMYNPRNPQPLRFHAEDIIQSASERMRCGGCQPRTPLRRCGIHGTDSLHSCSRSTQCLRAGGSAGPATCLLDNFMRVAGRVIAALLGRQPDAVSARLTPEQAAALEKLPPKEAAEGLAALFLYSYEIKAPTGTPDCDDGSRPTQLYKLLGCAMRNLGDPAARARLSEEQLEVWERVVELMRPFTWRLDKILLALPHQPRVVYRGIDTRVSDEYTIGSVVLWPPVTSTSASKEVAWQFMSPEGSGTFFIILTLSVADIAAFSWLPEEDEWLLHTLSVHRVTDKMRPGLRAMVGTNHDMVCLVQVDGRSGLLPPAEMVRARELALREQTLLFDDFLKTYVPPAVKVGHTLDGLAEVGSRRRMLEALREFCAAEERAVLIVGDGGCGKTSTALRLARAAADARDPLPLAPGCDTRWVPMLITLPVVDRLLTPGTGEGCVVRPLTDYIVASNHLSPDELAEMQQRPLLLVLDGLEELPDGLSRMRGRGLLAAGGLDLSQWPNTKVVLCIRGEVLQQPRGCSRWRLTEHDVLPGGLLWHVQDFESSEIAEFTDKVVRKEILNIALTGAKAAPGAEDEALQRSVAALSCAPPPRDSARDLQIAARRLYAEGHALDAAVEKAVDSTAAGAACTDHMRAATAAVIFRLRAVDATLVSSPFVLSMAVAVGRDLAGVDFSSGTRRAVYGTWLASEVRRRLPRVASRLAARSPEFAAMDEGARVELVLDFCAALACSPLLVDVTPSLLMIANLRRYASVARVVDYDLSPLGREHNAALLQAAPLRVETGERALLSFQHASVQDYFTVTRVLKLSALGDARQHPDVQRVALVGSRSGSLQSTVDDAMENSADNPIKHLRCRVTVLRYCQSILAVVLLFGVIGTAAFDALTSRLIGAAYGLLWLQVFMSREASNRWKCPLHYVMCGMAFAVFCAATVARLVRCRCLMEQGGGFEHKRDEALCGRYPLHAVLLLLGIQAPSVIVVLEPQYLVSAVAGLRIYELRSTVHRRIVVAASASGAVTAALLAYEVGLAELYGVVAVACAVTFAAITYRVLQHSAQVWRS